MRVEHPHPDVPAWASVREYFEPDGALRDLYVPQLGARDWDRILRALPGWGCPVCCEFADRQESEFHPATEALAGIRTSIQLLRIDVDGIILHGRPADFDFTALDLDPNQVDQGNYPSLARFVERIAELLHRPAGLSWECAHERTSFLVYDPEPGSWTLRDPYDQR